MSIPANCLECEHHDALPMVGAGPPRTGGWRLVRCAMRQDWLVRTAGSRETELQPPEWCPSRLAEKGPASTGESGIGQAA